MPPGAAAGYTRLENAACSHTAPEADEDRRSGDRHRPGRPHRNGLALASTPMSLRSPTPYYAADRARRTTKLPFFDDEPVLI